MESPLPTELKLMVVNSNIQAPSEVFFARRTDYLKHLRADCRRRTTNSAVTVTVGVLRASQAQFMFWRRKNIFMKFNEV